MGHPNPFEQEGYFLFFPFGLFGQELVRKAFQVFVISRIKGENWDGTHFTLFIQGFLAGEYPRGVGGCFPPPPCNSFVFKVRRLEFCTELFLW